MRLGTLIKFAKELRGKKPVDIDKIQSMGLLAVKLGKSVRFVQTYWNPIDVYNYKSFTAGHQRFPLRTLRNFSPSIQMIISDLSLTISKPFRSQQQVSVKYTELSLRTAVK